MSSLKDKYFDFVNSEDYEQYCSGAKNSYQQHLQALYDDFKQQAYLSTPKRVKPAGKRFNLVNKVK